MAAEHPHVRSDERVVAGFLVVGVLGALAAAVVYGFGGQPQLEGVFLAVTFGGLGGGLVVWAHRLLPGHERTEAWEFAPQEGPTPEENARRLEAFHEDLDRDDVLGRRPLLRRLLLVTLGSIGVAAVFPIRSLGPCPGNALRVTAWRRGLRVVDAEGRSIDARNVPVGGIVTVFPEGHEDAADAVAVLIRVPDSALESADPDMRSTGGLLAYRSCAHTPAVRSGCTSTTAARCCARAISRSST